MSTLLWCIPAINTFGQKLKNSVVALPVFDNRYKIPTINRASERLSEEGENYLWLVNFSQITPILVSIMKCKKREGNIEGYRVGSVDVRWESRGWG